MRSYFLERERVSEWIPRVREWTLRRRWGRSWAPRGEIFPCLDGLLFLYPGRASQYPGESRAKSSPVPGPIGKSIMSEWLRGERRLQEGEWAEAGTVPVGGDSGWLWG